MVWLESGWSRFHHFTTLTSPRYIEMLTTILREFLNYLNLIDRHLIFVQQDGALVHNFQTNRKIIGRQL